MASRNQNRPPRSPSSKKEGVEGIPLDKRRRIGMGRTGGATNVERKPFGSVNRKLDVTATSDVGSCAEGSDCGNVEFTKEEVDAMVNERLKMKKFDHKGNLELVSELNARLKVCIKWFQKRDESHVEEEGKLQIALDALEKKCTETEAEMKNKEERFSATISELRQDNACLQERLSKEESEKLDAIACHRKENEARIALEALQASLSKDLEKAQQDILAANQRASSVDDMYKRLQEYNLSLQQYNSKLHAELEVARESLKRVEKEKSTIVENHSTLRGRYSSLQDQLNLARTAQDEALNQKDTLANEVKCLRGELQQVREDRDRQVAQVQALTSDVVKYKESTGESCAKLEYLMEKTKSLEETCSSQREQICLLEHQLTAANEKLKMSDLSSIETRTEFEKQKRTVRELQERLAETENQLVEGEKLRKKLHNTILELKGNIRVFCRVRPVLPDDGAGSEPPVISYPTSTEALGRGIDVIQSAGQKYPFTFDKVFNHDASQQEVFVEISQLVQSALDGYKVCIFAYGQTGSGKTYTMMGRPEAAGQKGLIPRSLEQIFQTSQSLMAQGWKYKMQASMLEIYNETIRDLLSTNKSSSTENGAPGKQYTIKHDANGNTYVTDLTIVDVCRMEEISSLLRQAAQSRSVGKTQMNEQSSRSHFVFTLRISGVNEGTEQQVQGVLNLIDLAGSERLSRSGATGDRLKETQAINRSLSCLSDVIFALAKKEDHVPFRNSKLTYLLQPCLGGDSKTLMFVNISPDPASVGESLCSLRFAARVNACEIGIPRRQMLAQTPARPADSRLSYG
ncbi:kinesin-like protein KIN-14C isoform X1 [Populus alba x Populus x berolinensis]|uniref:Kinesin-like protein n=1 Tax=Populus alba x Populus x berolinensis TaxID=444605 RepID=A0AAD6Q6F1_9ROSI|nr:kinesin-like protein KIN-14C isoform X1 [Populus alba]KAJ6893283.1 kinesin-like protein KIN-14C isoform X1 [Populus alba x Populus x berolinensis]KAJ6978848.1 kinesin-like protein KIN-14C isoform X1 [Populus alba x Populus x berolinensis]